MELKIYCATHLNVNTPKDEIYQPIFVGADLKKYEEMNLKKCIYDNTGDNISKKNLYYCELTAVYWIWKNSKYDYVGLCHYRRYFLNDKREKIVNKSEIINIFDNYDVIMRKMFLSETVLSQFINNHFGYIDNDKVNPMNYVRKVIEELYPKYLKSFDYTLQNFNFYYCNMIISSKVIFDEYCEWLFSILFKVEELFKEINYKPQLRLYGYISERLLGVWISNQNLRIKVLPVLELSDRELEKI